MASSAEVILRCGEAECGLEVEEEENFRCFHCPDLITLCIECGSSHIRKKHKVTDNRGFEPSFCGDHKRINYYYCRKCDKFLCLLPKCQAPHKDCGFKSIKEEAVIKRKKLFEDYAQLELQAKPLEFLSKGIETFNEEQKAVVERYQTMLQVDYINELFRPAIEKFVKERIKSVEEKRSICPVMKKVEAGKENCSNVRSDLQKKFQSLFLGDYETVRKKDEVTDLNFIVTECFNFYPSQIVGASSNIIESRIEKLLQKYFVKLIEPIAMAAYTRLEKLTDFPLFMNDSSKLNLPSESKKFQCALLGTNLFFYIPNFQMLFSLSLTDLTLMSQQIILPKMNPEFTFRKLLTSSSTNKLLLQFGSEVFSLIPSQTSANMMENVGFIGRQNTLIKAVIDEKILFWDRNCSNCSKPITCFKSNFYEINSSRNPISVAASTVWLLMLFDCPKGAEVFITEPGLGVIKIYAKVEDLEKCEKLAFLRYDEATKSFRIAIAGSSDFGTWEVREYSIECSVKQTRGIYCVNAKYVRPLISECEGIIIFLEYVPDLEGIVCVDNKWTVIIKKITSINN